MKKLFLILSLGIIFSCSKNNKAENESGTTMMVDSTNNDNTQTSAETAGTAPMADSASTATSNSNTAVPNPSPSTTPAPQSKDSMRSKR